MKLSVIIVNYKSREYLEKCLASVFAKISKELVSELIVVNNGLECEMRGLGEMFPCVKIVQNTENGGFGGANNLGAKKAQGEILFFVNPDAEIVSENANVVISEFENKPNLGILGSRIITPEGMVQKWIAGGKINLWSVLRNNLRKSRDEKYWQSKEASEVFWVAGTALFVRKEPFLELGGFDEQFFLYFEDVDLCSRAQLLNKKVLYFPGFSVLHHGGKSFSKKCEQKKGYYSSQDYYFRKHLGFFQTMLLKILRYFSFYVQK